MPVLFISGTRTFNISVTKYSIKIKCSILKLADQSFNVVMAYFISKEISRLDLVNSATLTMSPNFLLQHV